MNKTTATDVIEPEILDECGNAISAREPAAHQEQIHVYHRAGFLTGFVALAFSCVMLLLGALVTIFIVAPLLLLGRLIGLQVKSLRR